MMVYIWFVWGIACQKFFCCYFFRLQLDAWCCLCHAIVFNSVLEWVYSLPIRMKKIIWRPNNNKIAYKITRVKLADDNRLLRAVIMGTVKVEELMVIDKLYLSSNVSSSLRTKTKKTKIPKKSRFLYLCIWERAFSLFIGLFILK